MTEPTGFVNGLPQTGFVLDTVLADAIGISRETLVDWLVKYEIPHKRPGTRIFVNCEQFYAGLPDGLSGNYKPKGKAGD